MKCIRALVLGAVCFLTSTASIAKEIQLLIPTGPGGFYHRAAMGLAPLFSKWLDQPVVIVSKPGGNGSVSAVSLANEKNPAILINGVLLDSPIDQLQEIVPIAYLGSFLPVIYVHSASTISEFSQLPSAKKTFTYGVVNGAPATLNMRAIVENMHSRNDNRQILQEVLYKTAADVTRDVIGKHIDIGVGSLATGVGELVQEGRLRPIAILGAHRSLINPQIPTVVDLGYAKSQDVFYSNIVLWVNPKTPLDTRQLLQKNLNTWVRSAEANTFMKTLDAVVTPEQIFDQEKVIKAITKK